jgi:hypothetical protein
MNYYILRIDCPGHEFGLEDCEEKLTRRGWYCTGGFLGSIPDGDEQEDWDTYCDCEKQIKLKEDDSLLQRYYDRVNELFDKAEPEDDYPDEDDYIYEI